MAIDRDKALDVALGAIEKQFGKGAIMRMGEGAKQKIAIIPTGAIGLDVALGTGGFPRGRVVEIFGPESSGKCLVANTYLWTDLGLETIEELFARVGQVASCTSRMTDVSAAGVRLVNEEGGLEHMAAVTHNNRRPTWTVAVESGRAVTATANHPLRVLNERGEIVWRRVCDLSEGDILVSGAFGAERAEPDGLSMDEAALLGYLIAEGTLGQRHSVVFTNHHDPDVLAEYEELLQSVLGVDPDRVKHYGAGDHVLHDTAVRRRLAEDYDLRYDGSAAKVVPHCVRTAGAKAQRAFLSALFEGDGWVEAGPKVALTSASEVLVEQVQLLLLGLGIPCSRSTRWNTEYQRNYWTVLVPPGAVARFLSTVGFRSTRRAGQVERYLRDSTPATRWEAVPGAVDLVRDLRDAIGGDRELDRLYHDLTRSDLCVNGDPVMASRVRLAAIVAWADARHVPAATRPLVERLRSFAVGEYTYERITSITDAGMQPTFDVVLPKTHSFLANGVLSHNTSIALHAIAEAQKAGGVAAFIDAEHALDPIYAAAIGVDMDSLLVSQPDTGEQALEITDTLVRSGAIDLIVIDSVAALTPRAEIEGEMGDSHVGLQARLMSQALRKLSGNLHRSRTCCIFINQLREKIGVMFGCLSWDTKVTLADGAREYIGKIVNQKLPVEVLSYDWEREEIVPKRVTGWFDNGATDSFLHVKVANSGPTGASSNTVVCTANHQIMTPFGWREAQELVVGDRIIRSVPHYLSEQQYEVVLGGLMGDAALSPNANGLAARLRWGHGAKQEEYGDWKASLFSNVAVSRGTNEKGAVFHDFQPLPELRDLREAVYLAGKKVLSWDYLKRLTPLSLAIWYMDDGTFSMRSKGLQKRTEGGSGRSEICVEAFSGDSQLRLRDHLRDTFGISTRISIRGGNAVLTFPTAETAKFHELIAPFVHHSMQYKLLPRFQGRFDFTPDVGTMRYAPMDLPVLAIEQRPPAAGRTHRYDIEVEGSHNYFANGVMVHNSPETTPGGRALKFYSSVRLDIRRIESLKDGTDFVGNRVRVKVVKNKLAPPFRQTEFDIMFGLGISREGSLLDMGVEHGIIRKAGAWFTYDGEQLGQGRENARSFLKEHTEVADEIYKKTTELLGLVQTDVTGDDALAVDELVPDKS